MSNVSRAFTPAMLLATGSFAGMADAATTVTYNYDPGVVAQTVSIAGTSYYSLQLSGTTAPTTTLTSSTFNGSFGAPINTSPIPFDSVATVYTSAGFPTASENFDSCATFTARTDVDSYAHLRFSLNGVDQLGYAAFTPTAVRFAGGTTSAARLVSITYDTAAAVNAAVPEPATWAEMILGLGAVGGAMRAVRRRKNQTLANA